jgi:hypothetical protein
MGKHGRQIYAPPSYVFVAEEGPPRRQAFLATLMVVVVAAFSAFVWNVYGVGDPPRIRATGDYKVRPPPDAADAADAPASNTLYDALEGRAESGDVDALPPPEEPMTMEQQTAPPRMGPAPRITANGAFVAQVAAIRSQGAVADVWRRIAAQSPALFARARPDIERADLGAGGIYYRVRAGYFADRANASLFCDRVRALGQDCIVAAR